MKNWETTLFGVLSAVGGVLAIKGTTDNQRLIGLCLLAAGNAGMGICAASTRGVQKTINDNGNNNEKSAIPSSGNVNA